MNSIIFLSGLLSQSFAFFIIIFVSLLLHLLRGHIKSLITLILVTVSLYNAPFFDSFFANRLSNGSGINDNRTTYNFEVAYENYLNSSDVFFGKGVYSSIAVLDGSSSYKSIIYDVGLFGCLIFFIFHTYIFLSSYNKEKSWYLVVFYCVFLLSLYQRPYLITPAMFFVFLAGCKVLEAENNDE